MLRRRGDGCANPLGGRDHTMSNSRIQLCLLVGLTVYFFVMAFEVPVGEYCVSCNRGGLIHGDHGPDVLIFRARHRNGKYSKEYLRTMMERRQKRIEENKREAKAKGLTHAEFWYQNPPGIQALWEWEEYVAMLKYWGEEPTEPSNLTLSLFAGVGLPLMLLSAALFVPTGGRGKPQVSRVGQTAMPDAIRIAHPE